MLCPHRQSQCRLTTGVYKFQTCPGDAAKPYLRGDAALRALGEIRFSLGLYAGFERGKTQGIIT